MILSNGENIRIEDVLYVSELDKLLFSEAAMNRKVQM